MESAHLHSELCNQIVLRVRAETWASRNLDSAVDHRHGLGERRGAEIGKHPLERSNLFPLPRGNAAPLEKPVPDKKAFGTQMAPACSTSAATFAIAVMPSLTMLG